MRVPEGSCRSCDHGQRVVNGGEAQLINHVLDRVIPSLTRGIFQQAMVEDVVEVWVEAVTREDRHYLLLGRVLDNVSVTVEHVEK